MQAIPYIQIHWKSNFTESVTELSEVYFKAVARSDGKKYTLQRKNRMLYQLLRLCGIEQGMAVQL
jgi:hypothetical protein